MQIFTNELFAFKSLEAGARTLTPRGSLHAMRSGFTLLPDDWVFAGVASTPDVDLVGEVVYPESFEKSLQEFVDTGNVFYEHMYKDPSKVPPGSMLDQRLALPVMAEIHDGALWVYGVLDKEHPKAQEVWKALNRRDERFATKSIGLSIGARPLGRSTVMNLPDGRVVKRLPELKLYEVSFTYQPVNQFTWAMALKSMLAGDSMPDQTQQAPDAQGPGAQSAPTDSNPETVDAPSAGGGESPANPSPNPQDGGGDAGGAPAPGGDPAAGGAPAPGGDPAAGGAPGAPGGDPAAGGAPGAPGADPAAGGAPADPGAGTPGASTPASPGDPNTGGGAIGDLLGQGGDSGGGDDPSKEANQGLLIDKVDNLTEQVSQLMGLMQTMTASQQQGAQQPGMSTTGLDENALKSMLSQHSDNLKDFIELRAEVTTELLSLVKSLSAAVRVQQGELVQLREQMSALGLDLNATVKSLASQAPAASNPAPVVGGSRQDVLGATLKSLTGQAEAAGISDTREYLVKSCRAFDDAANQPSLTRVAVVQRQVLDDVNERFGISNAQAKDLFNRIRAKNYQV
jgi:hypothetical protein